MINEFTGKRVTIMSCSDCNANCKHCYISYKGNIKEENLLEMCKKLFKRYQVNINGTEILLHKNFLKSIALIHQYRILTNGIILSKNDDILKEIKKSGVNTIAMSYHFKIHNDVSTVEEEVIKENINRIQKAGLRVELMCTITKKNYDKIEFICDYVRSLNINKIRFINYLKTGNALKMKKEMPLNDLQKEMFFKQVRMMRKKYKKDELLIKRCGSFGKDIYNEKCNFECSAGYDEVVIAPDMKVYPCIFMVKQGFEIGQYKNGKVLINKKISHNQEKCIANEIYNNDSDFYI